MKESNEKLQERNSISGTRSAAEKNMEILGQICFFAGLFLELLILILDKSAYQNVYESLMFRTAFLLFAVKVCLTKYTKREWLFMIAAGLLSVIGYRVSGRDEIVRFAVFCFSIKGLSEIKILKISFWVTFAGSLLLVLLSVTGIYGSVSLTADFGRGEGEVRYCMGMGHPNAFACMVFVLMALGIYLYHEKMKLWHYALLLLLTAAMYVLTVSRAGLLMMAAVLALSVLYTVYPKAKEWKWLYDIGMLACAGGIAFSVVAAYFGKERPMVPVLDRLLTGRVYSAFDYTYGGGAMKNWHLFSSPDNTIYFDMGYIRLFYWYGIVFACIYLIMYAAFLWKCRKEKDGFLFMMLVCFAVYTVFEAHFISVYLARNYMLVLFAAGAGSMLHLDSGTESHWWQVKSLRKCRE